MKKILIILSVLSLIFLYFHDLIFLYFHEKISYFIVDFSGCCQLLKSDQFSAQSR